MSDCRWDFGAFSSRMAAKRAKVTDSSAENRRLRGEGGTQSFSDSWENKQIMGGCSAARSKGDRVWESAAEDGPLERLARQIMSTAVGDVTKVGLRHPAAETRTGGCCWTIGRVHLS